MANRKPKPKSWQKGAYGRWDEIETTKQWRSALHEVWGDIRLDTKALSKVRHRQKWNKQICIYTYMCMYFIYNIIYNTIYIYNIIYI